MTPLFFLSMAAMTVFGPQQTLSPTTVDLLVDVMYFAFLCCLLWDILFFASRFKR